MSEPRESHTATLLEDGRVLIIGGHRGRREGMVVHASAEIFDPRTGRFERAGTLAIPRHKHDAVRLADGRVLVIGGADRTDRVHFASTEIYRPMDRSFQPGPSMANRRYKIAAESTFREVPGRFPAAFRFAAAALLREGDVLIAGGYSDGNVNTAGVWRFGQP
jgi:hypothetical protein